MKILVFLLMSYVCFFIHELGHYLAFKTLGYSVEILGVGFGPSLGFKKRTTTYKIGLLPFGGYVIPVINIEELSLLKKYYINLSGISFNFAASIIAIFTLAKDRTFEVVTIILNAVAPKLSSLFTFEQIITKENSLQYSLLYMDQIMLSFEHLLLLFGIFNFLICILNLIPIPVLDGGKIIMDTLEVFLLRLNIKQKTINRIQTPITIASWCFMIALLLIPTIIVDANEKGVSFLHYIMIYIAVPLVIIILIANLIKKRRHRI